MQKLLLLILCLFVLNTSNAQVQHPDSIIANYRNAIKNTKRLSYQAQRIDTFPSGQVWNRSGNILIEKNRQDKQLGINFYGKKEGATDEYLYYQSFGYELNPQERVYLKELAGFGSLGSPVGQLVAINMMYEEGGHETLSAQEEKEFYVLNYTFADEPDYGVLDRKRKVYLDKKSYLPVRFSENLIRFDEPVSQHLLISNIKTNASVDLSIAQIKSKIQDYKDESEESAPEEPSLAGAACPKFTLSPINDSDNAFNIPPGQASLIVFWEIWCSPCIKSLPDLQEINSQYKDQLQVVGITSSDRQKTIDLLKDRGASFVNLAGNDEVFKAFKVSFVSKLFSGG